MTFAEDGFTVFPQEPATLAWAGAARPYAQAALADPDMRARWLVCEGTWFVGVDALPNDSGGAIGGVPLGGRAYSAACDEAGGILPLHPAQLSVVWPGYPRPRTGESEAAFRYRRNRDAAHVDGLKAVGPQRKRQLDEAHAFILGIALDDGAAGASPLVVWRGSHRILGQAFGDVLSTIPASGWPDVDLSKTYSAARTRVFETCERVALPMRKGEAVLLHRHCLHGVSPWIDNAQVVPRSVAYFRPILPPDRVIDWI